MKHYRRISVAGHGRASARPAGPAGETSAIRQAVRLALASVLIASCGNNPLVAPRIPDAATDAEPPASGLVLRPVLEPIVEAPSRVNVRFTVETDLRQPVPGLTENSFTVLEDGESLSGIESAHRVVPASEAFEFFSVMLIDMSASVRQDLGLLQDAANALVDEIPDGLKVALYTFDGRPGIRQQLAFSDDRGALRSAIAALGGIDVVDPSTNLNGAVIEAIEAITAARAEAAEPNETGGFLVTFTDATDRAGFATDGQAVQAVNSVRHPPFVYSAFTVGLGAEINREQLERLGPDGFEFAGNSAGLGPAFRAIGNKLSGAASRFYLLSYCSPKRTGGHRLQINAEAGDLFGKLTTGFRADGFSGGCVPLE